MKEACGVVGIVAPGRSVAHLCFDALFALQHRGQESAGMATFQNEQITVVKDNGLVSAVFAESTLRALGGSLVIGHTRYSTSGSANWTAAQPVYRSAGVSGFALGHNGNLTNTLELAAAAGIEYTSMLSDSDLVAELLAREVDAGLALEKALGVVLGRAEGAFSMVILESDQVHAVRDPYGFRPLCLGRLGTADAPEGWIVASESPALDVVGATFVREIEPGEMVTITKDGVSSLQLLEPALGKQKLCIFEFVYFARPDAYLMGHQVHTTRRRMGELLASQSNVPADIVMLVKNRYIGRTFIAPDQNNRNAAVRRKFNPLRENIEGQRLIVVDDSIVRGTTTKALVSMLRDAGAKEVHLRISSPPFAWPCYYGIDTPNRDELLAANHSIAEINDFVGSDTLEYITLANLRASIQLEGECCDACLTGSYPAPIPVTISAAATRW